MTSKSTPWSHFFELVHTKTLCGNVQDQMLYHGHDFELVIKSYTFKTPLAGINWMSNPDSGNVIRFKLPIRLSKFVE